MSYLSFIKALILISAFYSFTVTIIAHTLPEPPIPLFSEIQRQANNYELSDVAEKIRGTYETQTNLPMVEMAAIIFYSGNLLIDLLANFITAIPSMFTLLVEVVFWIVNVPAPIASLIKLVIYVGATAIYLATLINILVTLRTGRYIV
jgi:hypothetical protein